MFRRVSSFVRIRKSSWQSVQDRMARVERILAANGLKEPEPSPPPPLPPLPPLSFFGSVLICLIGLRASYDHHGVA